MNSPSAPVSSRTFVSTVLFPVTVLITIGMEMCIDLILESVIITEEILSVSIVTIEFSSNMSSYNSSFSSGSMPATMFLICANTVLAVFLYCPNFWFGFCSSEFCAKFSFSWRLDHWPFATCSVLSLVDCLSTSIVFGSCSFGVNLGMKGFLILFVVCALEQSMMASPSRDHCRQRCTRRQVTDLESIYPSHSLEPATCSGPFPPFHLVMRA